MTCGLATALEPPHFNHAPVRGATQASRVHDFVRTVSIHAPARGATAGRGARYLGHIVSIHAPARGATCHLLAGRFSGNCFNPRTRVGCDVEAVHGDGADGRVSIHAPAWGATIQDIAARLQNAVSIHAPAWGATFHGARPVDNVVAVSIHAPAWGATNDLPPPELADISFNPRTRVGCDNL